MTWNSDDLIAPEWRSLLVAAKGSRCVDLVREMAVTFSNPEDVTHEAVAAWAQKRLEMGMSFGVTKVKRSAFWKLLRRFGVAKHAPPSLTRGQMYSTPMGALPEPLQSELRELLAWKLADFRPDRPADAQIRPVTAKRLEMQVRAIHGFAAAVGRIPDISSLRGLLEKPVVTAYVSWSLNVRRRKGQYLRNNLSLLRSATRQHPSFASIALDWMDPLMASIPTERESEARRRKAEKFLDYDKLSAVPDRMLGDRPAVMQDGQSALARHVMAELLIRWMTVLPWRQRNVRECRLNGPSPNVFKGPISPFSEIDLPEFMVPQVAGYHFRIKSELIYG